MIGTTLGRYRITAKLGEGGMGSVWRAEDPALGRTVALKLLSPALLGSEVARQRFLREARAVSQLDHPNIATVYDVGETDGHAWIAYQFVDGETVAARTADGALPVADAITLALGTAEALAHAHAHQILHRDVTAGNVMVARDGRAVLVDFGLALLEHGPALTSTGMLMGTAGYIAPELMRGESPDARADLYGLGGVLYRMLTGRLPFEGGPPEAVYYRVLNERVVPPSDLRPEISAPLERVVMRLLERDPADRFQSAGEPVETLRALSPAEQPTPSEQARRRAARRLRASSTALKRLVRVRVGVTTLVGIAVLGTALWFAGQRGWLPGTHRGPPVIAVMPFENTSEDPEDAAFLGEGLGEELVLKLGQADRFNVIPWATTRALPKPSGDLKPLARQLHVDALLVGSYRSDGERVRVTVTLVDGRSGVQRWSQAFDELLTDLMTVQGNIAAGVAKEIQGGLEPAEKAALTRHATADPQAYELYLRGAAFLNAPDAATQALAQPFFEKAVEADSTLAEAYVGLGAIQLDRYFRGENAGHDVIESAEGYMRHALALQPGMPRALRGILKVAWLNGRTEECLRIGEIAARRGDEDVEGLLIRGWACMLGNMPEVGVPILDRVLELDPSNREAAWFRVISLNWKADYPSALESGKEFIRKYGEDPEIYTWMGASAIVLGHTKESLTYYDRALELFGEDQSNLYSVAQTICVRFNSGDTAGARKLALEWRDILRSRMAAVQDNDRVLRMLLFVECALEDRDGIRRDLPSLIRLLHSPRQDHSDGTPMVLRALGGIDELGLASQLIEALRKGDLANCGQMLQPQVERFTTMRPIARLEALPEYQSLVHDVRLRREQVYRRYAPTVGLRDRRDGMTAVPTSSH